MTILQLNNVTYTYPGTSKPTLTQINYQVFSGDFIILLGGNGSGKSSLLKLIHKQCHPEMGDIVFNNTHYRISQLNQNCEESLFTSLTIYENYLIHKKFNYFSKMDHRHERQNLSHLLFDFNPNLITKLDVSVAQLSGGEKQALALAFCMLNPPSLLLLDEHTSALDPKTSEQIMRLTQTMLTRHRITCLLTTHDLDLALHYGNRILILKDGNELARFDDREKALLTREKLREHY